LKEERKQWVDENTSKRGRIMGANEIEGEGVFVCVVKEEKRMRE
jgi:hypothetical protein